MPEWFEALQNGLFDFLQSNLYVVLALYVGIEEAGVPFPLPADTAIVFAGYQVFGGQANPFAVVAIVVIAATIGASILYWASRLIGPRLLERVGRFLHITPERQRRAEHWFRRYQVPAVVIGRLIPGFRVVITIVAGTARGNFWVFLPSAAFSALIWALIFMTVGWVLGEEYQRFRHALVSDPKLSVAIALGLLALIVGAIAVLRRARRKKAARTAAEAEGEVG
jgi:membrane protein DedA with SNARE-associated domain